MNITTWEITSFVICCCNKSWSLRLPIATAAAHTNDCPSPGEVTLRPNCARKLFRGDGFEQGGSSDHVICIIVQSHNSGEVEPNLKSQLVRVLKSSNEGWRLPAELSGICGIISAIKSRSQQFNVEPLQYIATMEQCGKITIKSVSH